MRSNQLNFRRELKILRKNLQRKSITDQGICEWFQDRGVLVEIDGLVLITWILNRKDIRGRVWARIGRAAKKKGAFVQIGDLMKVGSVWSKYKGLHEPPFVRVEKEIKTETIVRHWEEKRIVDLEGNVLNTSRSFIK